jgi:hypothetical protein
LDTRTGPFSFDTVLYDMATGRQAFSGHSAGVIVEVILNRPPVATGQLNPELSPKLEEVINWSEHPMSWACSAGALLTVCIPNRSAPGLT